MSVTVGIKASDVSLREAHEMKVQLESAINALVVEYSNKTGLLIDGIRLNAISTLGGDHIRYDVSVEVGL